MTDIYDAIARGFRYPGRPSDDDGDDLCDVDEQFGDETPRSPLPLQSAQAASLAEAVHADLAEHGCDNTLRAARAWARRKKVPWSWLRAALEERGGFCDCEVLMNVLDSPD